MDDFAQEQKQDRFDSLFKATRSDLRSIKYFKAYLDNTSQTETPELVRIWCAVFGLSSTLSRHAYLDRGPLGKLFPNLYVVLSGPAASRKSTAMKTLRQLLWDSKAMIRFGPDDTAGQYYGIIKAMQLLESRLDSKNLDSQDMVSAKSTLDSATRIMQQHGLIADMAEKENLAENDVISKALGINWMISELNFDDINSVVSMPHELPSLLGTKNDTVGRFLNVAYDSVPYTYVDRKGRTQSIQNPLVNLLASTQPEVLESTLSEQSMRDGFMSRTIFVYTTKRVNLIPFPSFQDESVKQPVLDTMNWCSRECIGGFTLTEDAKAEYSRLYKKQRVWIEDSRFLKYNDRRMEHWLKVAMCIASAEHTKEIRLKHLLFANNLLQCTESVMHQTLGFFGTSKESQLIAKMLNWFNVVAKDKPIKQDRIIREFQTIMDKGDILNQLAWLCNINELYTVTLHGNTYYALNRKSLKENQMQEMLQDEVASSPDVTRRDASRRDATSPDTTNPNPNPNNSLKGYL